MRIAVFGAGAWGTALALAFSRNHDVVLWSREVDEIAALAADRENRRYLPGISLPAELQLSDHLGDAAQADLHHDFRRRGMYGISARAGWFLCGAGIVNAQR